MQILVVGDVHLGKRLYETTPRWKGKVKEMISDTFRRIMQIECDVRLFAGDFFNHYSVDEDVVKLAIHELSAKPDVMNYILGGNHDSTKTYSRVCSLDILAELPNVVVVNHFVPQVYELDENGPVVKFVPHMKSQEEFAAAIEAMETVDIAILHAQYGDRPPYMTGSNDLFLTPELAGTLSERTIYSFMGHVHKPKVWMNNIYQTGAIQAMGPREMGPHYVYLIESGVSGSVPQKVDTNYHDWATYRSNWSDKATLTDFLTQLTKFTHEVVFWYVDGVPQNQLKAIKAAYDAWVDESDRLVLVYFDTPDEAGGIDDIQYYDMSFNVRTELQLFAEETKMPVDQYVRLDGYLNDALAAEEVEGDDDN